MIDRRNFAEILDEYLGALRAGNSPDRQALLARHPDLADELQAALLGIDFVHGAAPRLSPEEHADALPGKLLGDYRLLRELGRGGMAVVYEAEQVSLARRVALKVLPFGAVLDPKQLQRFKNEAMAAAHLHHPNIVPVYGVGCERGVHYYAMQYVEGQSLATAIRDMKVGRVSAADGPQTPISSHTSNREPAYIQMAATLGVQAAEALDHAHQLGIVHRDVKPGNLLADVAGSLWVTDFGLASSKRDVGLTITGELLGTIRYMSPEQALAKRVPVDHRTDVYSLGATLYELFTLEPAFPGDDPHRVIQDIAFKEPVLPRRLNPALPRDLETVLLKAMSKDPAGRYSTAQELADDLTRYLENRPIEAKRPGLLRRASKWSRRHRTLVAATVVLLLLATAGLATGTALLWREQAHTEAAFDNAKANLALALEALDQIYIDEAEGHPKIREGLPRDLLQKGLGFYEQFVKENAGNKDLVFLMGNACRRAGLIFRALGDEQRAVESFDRAISAYDRAIAIDPRDFHAHNNRAGVLSTLGLHEEALAAFDQALAIEPRDAGVRNNRGYVLHDLGRFEEALAACDAAIAIDPRSGLAHNNRGRALCGLERFVEAIAACDSAIAIDPRDPVAYTNRGEALRHLGRLEEAIAAYDKEIEIDPRSLISHFNRGLALNEMRRFEEAVAEYDLALEIDIRDAPSHNSRGTALRELGRVVEALAAHDRAIEIDAKNAAAHNNRGLALCGLGRFEAALAACNRAIEIDPRNSAVHSNRCTALHGLGRLEEALAACDRAIEIDSRNALAHNNRGAMLVELGRPGDALVEFDYAIAIDPRYAAAHTNRGTVLRDLGCLDEALAACDQAIAIDPRADFVHCCRGNVLRDLGRLDEALAAHDLAIGINPRDATAHTNRGNVLRDLGRLDEAVAAHERALAIDPGDAEVHVNRGIALRDLGRFEEALAACDKAIDLDPRNAVAHYSRGNVLISDDDIEGAIEAYHEAIRLQPNFVEPYCNLGHALVRQGRFQEAVPVFRRAHELGSKRAGWAHPSARWLADAERRAELQGRKNEMLEGKAQPRDAVERVEFALALYANARHAESARLYAEAFAEDASLADDPTKSHRYNAACSAVLTAAPGGADAAEWRGRAIEWLRADLEARENALTGLAAALEHWKVDPAFASVRERLDDLPEPERAEWRGLWAAVDLALKSAGLAAK